jgi:hypothetical protein
VYRAAVSTWRLMRRRLADRAPVDAGRPIRRLHLAARNHPIDCRCAFGTFVVLRVRSAERRKDKDARKSQYDTYSHTTSAVSRGSDIEPTARQLGCQHSETEERETSASDRDKSERTVPY